MENNHEAYLELVENAVAETTQQLLAEGDTDIRKLTRRLAEKEVEIQRIKGHLVGERAKAKCLNKTLKELQGFYAICDEYLEGTETTRNPEFLGAYIEEKTGQLWEQDEMYSQIQGLEEEIEKWRKRMKKAEYWASEVIHYSHSASLDNLQAKKLITPEGKPTLAEVRDFGEEITQLKEENAKLKDCSYDEYCAIIKDENKLVKEFQDLKDECGELGDGMENLDCLLENQGEELSRMEAACEEKDEKIKWLEAEVQARKTAPTTRSQSKIKGLKNKVEKLEEENARLKKELQTAKRRLLPEDLAARC